MAGDKLERLHRVGVGDVVGVRDRARARGRRSTRTPTGSRVCRVDVGRDEPQHDRLRRAQRGRRADRGGGAARRRDARRLHARRGQAARRDVERDDPGRGRGGHRRGPRRDHGARPTTLPVGAPLAEHLPIADEVLELEITPNRPDLMGVYGVARDLHAVTAAAARRGPDRRGRRAERRRHAPRTTSSIEIDPEICLRFTARVFEDVKIGPVAAVAQAAADGGRAAADLERRRHHQLRDAHDRPAAARVRPRRGARRAHRGAPARPRASG